VPPPAPSSPRRRGSIHDGLSRRIVKAIQNTDDLDATFHYYYDGQSLLETRNGSNQTLKQYLWGNLAGSGGGQYIDELCQIAINQDPENADAGTNLENNCEQFFYALQDANYNVLGLVSSAGTLLERYEYTPYGQRTVFSHGYSPADFNHDGEVDSTDSALLFYAIAYGTEPADSIYDLSGDGEVTTSYDINPFNTYAAQALSADSDPLVTYATAMSYRNRASVTALGQTALCDVGHQGLIHDEELGSFGGLIHNRARNLHPNYGRFMQRDPLGYVDGMSVYEYVKSSPVVRLDSDGLFEIFYDNLSRAVEVRGDYIWGKFSRDGGQLDIDWSGVVPLALSHSVIGGSQIDLKAKGIVIFTPTAARQATCGDNYYWLPPYVESPWIRLHIWPPGFTVGGKVGWGNMIRYDTAVRFKEYLYKMKVEGRYQVNLEFEYWSPDLCHCFRVTPRVTFTVDGNVNKLQIAAETVFTLGLSHVAKLLQASQWVEPVVEVGAAFATGL
jgi:RHS repeat-associated protein